MEWLLTAQWQRTGNNSQFVEFCHGDSRVAFQKQIDTATNQTNKSA